MYQYSYHGGARKRTEEGIENLFGKKYNGKFSYAGKGNRHTSPGSTENSKQDEPKEAHSETHPSLKCQRLKTKGES